ncbi:MAG: hypothetical protein ACLUSP_03070 [Christensenellales bacterium]
MAGKTLYSVKSNETLAENVDGGTVYSGGQVVVYAGADVKNGRNGGRYIALAY